MIWTESGRGFLGPVLPSGSQPFMLGARMRGSGVQEAAKYGTYILTLIPSTPCLSMTCLTA